VTLPGVEATKEIDLVVDGSDEDDLAAVLREALEDNCQDFCFSVKGEPYVMPDSAVPLPTVQMGRPSGQDP